MKIAILLPFVLVATAAADPARIAITDPNGKVRSTFQQTDPKRYEWRDAQSNRLGTAREQLGRWNLYDNAGNRLGTFDPHSGRFTTTREG